MLCVVFANGAARHGDWDAVGSQMFGLPQPPGAEQTVYQAQVFRGRRFEGSKGSKDSTKKLEGVARSGTVWQQGGGMDPCQQCDESEILTAFMLQRCKGGKADTGGYEYPAERSLVGCG